MKLAPKESVQPNTWIMSHAQAVELTWTCVPIAGSVSDDDVSKPSEGKTDEWSLIQMAGRMEIISLHEISLAKFLGSGGYGEVSCPVVPSCVGFKRQIWRALGAHVALRWCI